MKQDYDLAYYRKVEALQKYVNSLESHRTKDLDIPADRC
jgi:hypothetical protein